MSVIILGKSGSDLSEANSQLGRTMYTQEIFFTPFLAIIIFRVANASEHLGPEDFEADR
jgi:hypothetical protein